MASETDVKDYIGHLITIIVLLGGMFIVWGATSQKLDDDARAISELQNIMKAHTDQLTAIRIEQERVRTVLEIKEKRGSN